MLKIFAGNDVSLAQFVFRIHPMTTIRILFPLDIQADCPEDELEDCLAFLPQDVRILSVLIGFTLVINLVLAHVDLSMLDNQPLFATMLTLHLIFCFFSLAILAMIQRLYDAGLLDPWAWARIVATSPDMLVVVENDHRLTRVNQTLANRLGPVALRPVAVVQANHDTFQDTDC